MKKKWNRVLPVLLVMVTAISLLSGCSGKSEEKEDAETITVYLWSTNLYEKYAPYIQEQLPDINVELSSISGRIVLSLISTLLLDFLSIQFKSPFVYNTFGTISYKSLSLAAAIIWAIFFVVPVALKNTTNFFFINNTSKIKQVQDKHLTLNLQSICLHIKYFKYMRKHLM